MQQTKALITGIGGFVGPYLTKTLLEHGYHVTGLIQAGVDKNPPTVLNGEQFKDLNFYPFDLTNKESIEIALKETKPDIIFHLAGFSSVSESFKYPHQTFLTNSLGTENLLESVRNIKPDCKFLFIGSSEEYGLQISSHAHYKWAVETYKTVFPPPRKIPELPVDESNVLRPLSPYAVSKVYGDYLSRTYWASYGLNSIVVRAFNHEGVGRGEDFVTSSITRQCYQIAMGNTNTILIGNVTAFRDWSHVRDIVEGYRILSEKGTPGEVYVLGSKRMNSVLTYILFVLNEFGLFTEAIETQAGNKRVEDPLQMEEFTLFGTKFINPRIDHLLLSKGLTYDLQDGGLRLITKRGDVNIIFDPQRYRTVDIPYMVSKPTKAERIGFKIAHSFQDIIHEQVKYRLENNFVNINGLENTLLKRMQ